MNIQIIHSNEANHPDYDRQVGQCANHGQSVRCWDFGRGIWFCNYCGHRVKVLLIGLQSDKLTPDFKTQVSNV